MSGEHKQDDLTNFSWCPHCEKLVTDELILNCDLCFKPGCPECVKTDPAGRLLCPRCTRMLAENGFYEETGD